MEYPKVNDVVICKVTKITDYGAFVSLLEYEGLEGYVHTSQVAPTWVKNIHNYVKLNSIRAAKVLKVDESKQHIDLSFSKVSEAEEKRKISEYRLFLRAESLMKVIAKELNISENDAWEKIADPIFEKEPNLYKGFINILKYGLKEYPGIDKKYEKAILAVLSKNIKIKEKRISTVLKITNDEPNGVEVIKKALLKIKKDFENVDVIYVSAGKYNLIVAAQDYKIATQIKDKVISQLEKILKGSTFEVQKQES